MQKLIRKFFATDVDSWSLLIVRLALGITIFPHGAQKVLGWFGGHGLEATLGAFTSMGMPLILAIMVVLAEFAGAIGVILGAGTRFMAFSLFITFSGAMFLGGHVDHGFFMNWYGTQAGEGIEYFIMVLGIAAALMVSGGGKCSVDALISKNCKKLNCQN